MAEKQAWQALNLEFPAKVPRTEYSAHFHWPLVKQVTGIDAMAEPERQQEASSRFVAAWDYGMMWNVLVHNSFLEEKGGRTTKMGHAAYQVGGTDFDPTVRLAFAEPEEALTVDPCREYGEFDRADLVRRFEEDYRTAVRNYPGALNMSGVYITLFSGLIEIFGFEQLLYLIGLHEKEFGKFIDGYAAWIRQFFEAYAATDIPVMMVHDDLCWTSGPVHHPDWYRRAVFPHIAELIGIVKRAGKKVYFTSDGTIDEFFDDIADWGVDAVVMEPTCDIRKFLTRHGKHCGAVGGMDCRDLMSKSDAEIEREMRDLMAFGKQFPGFMLAVGNHIPNNVPVDKALLYHRLYEELAQR